MALSLRFLSQASKNIVAHAPSPRAVRTPITPKTPKTPKSPQSPLSPLSTTCSGLSFFPVEEAKRAPKTARRSVHFADESGTWVGNASSLLSAKGLGGLGLLGTTGKFQPDPRTQATLDHSVQEEDPMALATATRAAVLARKARQEDRCVPTPRVALEPTFPVLLGRRPSVGLPMKSPLSFLNEESCAHAARQAFLEQQERRASRAMVDFVV